LSADRNGTGETLPALGAPGTSALQAQAAAGQALGPDLALRSAAEAAGYPATQSAGSGPNGSASGTGNAALATSLALATPPGVASGAAPAPLPEARLTAPPGHADFAPQLGAQISLFVREGVQQARLHLNPAELGPITVQIRLDGAGAQVLLAADHALTRQALEQAMPALAGSLREGGLTLTGGGVFDRANDPSGLTGQTGQPGHASQGGQSGQGVAGDPSRARAGQQLDGGPETNSVHDLSTPTRRGVVDLVA
jgi:flagellar hook-length control protein FliK